MTYEETVQYLYHCAPAFERVGQSAYKEGLQNTEALDRHFGHPHRRFQTIHVGGTNGKGSCSHTLAAVLQSAGMKVGLYTSPHLVDFRERIRVNGACIPADYVVDFVEQERHFFEPLQPSFFELTTALAFKYFADAQVDIAVVEVGLGGRLDCTNIIKPLVSVVTNISFDHTQFLGHTLAQIAGEKAGIIKAGVPVVIGETQAETRPIFQQKADKEGAPILFAEDEKEILRAEESSEGGFDYTTLSFGNIYGELGGSYQPKNANTILCALKTLQGAGLNITRQNIADGFAHVTKLTGLMGRWQTVSQRPRVVCDIGHNAGGWAYLSRQLKRQTCREMRIVFGMVNDKDIDTVLRLLPTNAHYYFTQASTPRALPAQDIAARAAELHLNGRAYSDPIEAYQTALNESHEDDFIFVGGSNYLVADLLPIMQN